MSGDVLCVILIHSGKNGRGKSKDETRCHVLRS